MAPRILIVDDQEAQVTAFARMLASEGYEIERASSGQGGLDVLENGGIDLMLLDVGMPGMSGIDVLARMRERSLTTPTIVISVAIHVHLAVQAIKAGAIDFVQKPVDSARLRVTVGNALRYSQLHEVHQQLRADVVERIDLVGDSPAMRRLKALIAKIGPSDGRVLIMGENGTGKELVAGALHTTSARHRAAFVKLNCGAVPKDLVESELFGHEKGAFTGALSARKGRFELADGGTLLLDEIGDMPMPMQVKLLRVLQEGQLERVGGTRSIRVDVRVLAASNRDLPAMVAEGAFREDLYYRLNVVTLQVPPLRERREDIPALVRHFCRPGTKGHSLTFEAGALEALQAYDFPGNVRELHNLVERLAILYAGEEISREHVRDMLSSHRGTKSEVQSKVYREGSSMKDLMHDLERRVLIEAIESKGGNKVAAATALEMERSHFYKKCRQHQIGGDET